MVENSWSHFDENQRKNVICDKTEFFCATEFFGVSGRIILMRKNYKPEVLERVMIINSITNRKADWPRID
jgi:hypothetical protein